MKYAEGVRMNKILIVEDDSDIGISHDLRTPLTSASGYIQMLYKDKLDEEKQIEYIQIIQSGMFYDELKQSKIEPDIQIERDRFGYLEILQLGFE